MRLVIVALLCVLGVSSASAQTPADSTTNQQLAFLDADAGLVVSLRLEQLKAAHDLASEMIPEERQAINLAGLGASAILGFYPFDPKAWAASGFDPGVPLLVQVAATGPGQAGLRTRVVLKARDAARARRTVERMRFRDKARLARSKEALLPFLAGRVQGADEAGLRKTLEGAGVFLIARPVPLSGVLFAQVRDGFVILDLFDPNGSSMAALAQTLERQPRALTTAMPGAQVLQTGPIAVWLRAIPLGSTLRRLAVGDRKRGNACAAIARLGASSSAEAVAMSGDIGARRVALDVQWHLRSDTTLGKALETREAPVLAGQGLLDAQVRFASWGLLRDRARPAEAQSWDELWAQAKKCTPGGSAYAVAIAWPEILGLFLSELSILHPKAAIAVQSLGASSAQIGTAADESVTMLSEAWVRGAGADVAKGWLGTLFGSERAGAGQWQWGHGSIAPYAIDREGGSVIGAGYRPGSRKFALHKSGRDAGESVAESQSDRVLLRLLANPALLAKRLATVPAPHLWRPWKSLAAQLQTSDRILKFSLELRRGGDR